MNLTHSAAKLASSFSYKQQQQQKQRQEKLTQGQGVVENLVLGEEILYFLSKSWRSWGMVCNV